MSLLDRFGRPVPDPPKERPALGFIPRTLPHREDFDVLTGVAPARPVIETLQGNDPFEYRSGR